MIIRINIFIYCGESRASRSAHYF